MISTKPILALLSLLSMSGCLAIRDDVANRKLHHYGKGYGKGGGKGQCKQKKYGKSNIKELYFDLRLEKGQNETILEDGPLRLFMTCNENSTNLKVNLEWHEDLLVFGDLAEDANLDDSPLQNQILQAGDVLEKNMWICCEGKDLNDGGVWLSTGHYVGLLGDSTVGIHQSNGADLDLAGDNYNCIVSGIVNYNFPKTIY